MFEFAGNQGRLQVSSSTARSAGTTAHVVSALNRSCLAVLPRDAGRMTIQLGTPRGRYDEHSSKFSLSKKPRFVDPVGKSQT
jgi:hypothetical protein